MDIIQPQQTNSPQPNTPQPHHASPLTKILLLIFSLLIIGVLGYAVYQQNYTVDTTDYNTNTKTDTSWKSYTNSAHEFSLTLTDEFKNYEVKSVTSASDTTALYYFNLKTTNPNYQSATNKHSAGYYETFTIHVFTPTQWNKLSALAKDSLNDIGSSSKFVYAYTTPQDGPNDLGKIDIKPVISSFKITTKVTINTSSWKTYTNSKYKFSINYPDNWFYSEPSNTNTSGETGIVNFGPMALVEELVILSSVFPNKSITEVQQIIKDEFKDNSTYISTETIKLGENTFSKLTFRNNINYSVIPIRYLIGRSGNVLTFSGGKSNSVTDSVTEQAEIDEILKSIKFTN